MAKRPVKLVFRSNPLMVGIVLVAAIFATVAVVTLQGSLEANQQRYEQLRQEAAELEAKNEELASDIDRLGSEESIRDIAEEELGLVDPDTVVFTPAID